MTKQEFLAMSLPYVTDRYLFWFEDEGKEGCIFEIDAKEDQ